MILSRRFFHANADDDISSFTDNMAGGGLESLLSLLSHSLGSQHAFSGIINNQIQYTLTVDEKENNCENGGGKLDEQEKLRKK